MEIAASEIAASELEPELEQIHSRWMQAMRAGDFQAAWKQTDRIEAFRSQSVARHREWGHGSGDCSGSQGSPDSPDPPDFEQPLQPHFLLWNGESWVGRHVVVYCNHGLGDTVQFVRFVPWLRREAKSVTLRVQPALLELLAQNDHLGKVINGWSHPMVSKSPSLPSLPSLPKAAVAMEIMELSYLFRVEEKTLPREMPYLRASPSMKSPGSPPILEPSAMAGRIRFPPAPGASEELKAGLHWGASPWDSSRSIPLRALRPLRKLSGVTFYSFQQGEAAGQWYNPYLPIVPLSRATKNLLHAAAALCQMDLVITVDSLLAHLAGALARPVWLLLKHQADWRWMQQRTDSPWYPTMRIFRQQRPGDWSGVGQAVAAALEHW